VSEQPRNVTVLGQRTSIRLEPEFWEVMEEMARRGGVSIHQLCSAVEAQRRPGQSRTSAIRAHLLRNLRLRDAAE
jgi:predicted DNA-binding ribbon-helix-helix protein